jgi:hypothetical protein
MMSDVYGFDVVAALNEHLASARIQVLVVPAQQITAEVRRAMSGRDVVA